MKWIAKLRVFLILLATCLPTCLPTSCLPTSCADEVHVINKQGKTQKRSGTITDLKGGELTLRSSGRETKIPVERITLIDATWSKGHSAANAKFANREFDGALELYRKAYLSEKRGWVKHQQIERVIWCYRNLGRNADACRVFGRLVREDPKTPYFDCIPLLWQRQQCPPDVKAIVEGWLGNDSPPANRLVAASWLMVQNRSRALSVLRQLGKDPSKQVSSLAIAQLWRAEMVTLQESRMAWWTEQMATTPPALRAGSYYLLGKSFSRFQQNDQATLALLRVPTMFPDDVVLGQQCLADAGEILLNQGQTEEAANVYRQSVKLNANSPAGKLATQRLAELVSK